MTLIDVALMHQAVHLDPALASVALLPCRQSGIEGRKASQDIDRQGHIVA
jgi:hypothetical protein